MDDMQQVEFRDVEEASQYLRGVAERLRPSPLTDYYGFPESTWDGKHRAWSALSARLSAKLDYRKPQVLMQIIAMFAFFSLLGLMVGWTIFERAVQ